MAWHLHSTFFTVDGEEVVETKVDPIVLIRDDDEPGRIFVQDAQQVGLQAAIDQIEALIDEDCLNPSEDQYSINVTASNPSDPWFDTTQVILNDKVVASFKVSNT